MIVGEMREVPFLCNVTAGMIKTIHEVSKMFMAMVMLRSISVDPAKL